VNWRSDRIELPVRSGGSRDQTGLRRESPQTGISADEARDFRQFSPQHRQTWSPETKSNARKAGISGAFSRFLSSPTEHMNGWLGRENSNIDMANSKSDALPCPRGATEPHFVKIHKPLETFEFREPYRSRSIQSSGEIWAIRRRIGRLCRFEVRSPNEKSLLPQGLIANKFGQRIHAFSRAGGESGIRTHGTDSLQERLSA
jgi:hypothetical protein